ncbi:hypothetical protein JQ641_29040 [Bradyrhizobium sp. JYMT SZCCT0180]|nr:hypothetical protein [Bradyrhizobium sp. JYMT SZCCT0180]
MERFNGRLRDERLNETLLCLQLCSPKSGLSSRHAQDDRHERVGNDPWPGVGVIVICASVSGLGAGQRAWMSFLPAASRAHWPRRGYGTSHDADRSWRGRAEESYWSSQATHRSCPDCAYRYSRPSVTGFLPSASGMSLARVCWFDGGSRQRRLRRRRVCAGLMQGGQNAGGPVWRGAAVGAGEYRRH